MFRKGKKLREDDQEFSVEDYKSIKQGLELFNQEKFWECHEFLEDYWMESKGLPIHYVYWAIIQVATSLYHFRNNNMEGATGMIQKAKDKLTKSSKMNAESPILEDKLSWAKFKKLVYSIPTKPKKNDFTNLYQFKFEKINEEN